MAIVQQATGQAITTFLSIAAFALSAAVGFVSWAQRRVARNKLRLDLFEKVESELMRPTFKLREKPLASICGFLGFDSLTDKLKAIQELGLASSLKPDFLSKTAEYFGGDTEP